MRIKTEPENILVIKMRNIGDVLLSSALFANLRLAFPRARISGMVNSGTEETLLGNPDIDRLYIYDRNLKKGSLRHRVQGELSLLATLRNSRFDLVMNLTEGDRGAITALISGARCRIGMDSLGKGMAGKNRIYTHIVPRLMPGLHAVEQNLEFLKALGIQPVTTRVSFPFDSADAETARARLSAVGLEPGHFFQAHCTSRWMFKTMPPATAARLIELLAERSGLPCLITSSPEEKELHYIAELRRQISNEMTPHFSDLKIKELGAITSMSRFFAGVDSAPMHIAAALDIPVLGVFGPSMPQIWGPWDNRMEQNPYGPAPGVQRGGRHTVLQSDAPCVPCGRDGCKGSKISDCLNFPVGLLESVVDDFVTGLALN